MNLPQKNRHWLKEIQKALSAAEKKGKRESIEIEYLYRYALDFVVKNRRITNRDSIEEIKKDIEDRVESDWGCEDESRRHYKFHFVSSYIFAHIPAGLLEEMWGDRVMEYINRNMDLFEE